VRYLLSILAASCSISVNAQTVRVEQSADSDQWQLLVDGEPYFIRGAGGDTNLELLKSLGGNTIRTWGADQLEPRTWPDGRTLSVMDLAHELELKVCAGFWVEHQSSKFSYDNPEDVDRQLADVHEFIKRWKDHPALLMWGVGNEVAGLEPERVFRELDTLAAIFKKLDPNHPTFTATAGVWPYQAGLFNQYCPNIDVLGINAYAGLPAVPQEIVRQGYTGPYIVTEYGPIGHWECAVTPWGAEVEQSAVDKSRTYEAFHNSAITNQPDRCLGGHVFLWGQKQERTDTWYSMFLTTGEKTSTVDTMANIWSGSYPENRAPIVDQIESDLFFAATKPGHLFHAVVNAVDHENDELTYEWVVRQESNDKRRGGEFELAPNNIPDCVTYDNTTGTVRVRTPEEAGNYRLFVYVRDGHGGGGSSNIPFRVE
jgi:hypothetical protein